MTTPGDTTRPRVYCLNCGTIRYCDMHTRAEHPPTSARVWLTIQCKKRGCKPRLEYAAGFLLGRGRPGGQA